MHTVRDKELIASSHGTEAPACAASAVWREEKERAWPHRIGRELTTLKLRVAPQESVEWIDVQVWHTRCGESIDEC